jgi:NhaP-type Na+/H+ or K+/H+ antiporter
MQGILRWPELPSESLGSWSRFYASLGIISAINLIFGLLSHFIKSQLFLSEALVALLAGIAFGPKGLDWIISRDSTGNLRDLATLFYHTSKMVLAVQTMAAGVSLPRAYIFRHWQSLLTLLGPVMVLVWIVGSIIVWIIFHRHISWLEAMMLGACIAPTDPVLVNSIIRGRFADTHVPSHLRTLITAESGANDGAALPLLMLPLLILLGRTHDPGMAGFLRSIFTWFTHVWLFQIALSIVIGVITGFGARKSLQYAEYHGLIDKESFLVFSLALAMALSGIVTLLGSNDLLAIFIAGVVFAWDDWFLEATKEAKLQEVIDSVFNLSYFRDL